MADPVPTDSGVVAAIAVVGAAAVTALGAVVSKLLDRRRRDDAPLDRQASDNALGLLALQDAIKERDRAEAEVTHLRNENSELRDLCGLLRAQLAGMQP